MSAKQGFIVYEVRPRCRQCEWKRTRTRGEDRAPLEATARQQAAEHQQRTGHATEVETTCWAGCRRCRWYRSGYQTTPGAALDELRTHLASDEHGRPRVTLEQRRQRRQERDIKRTANRIARQIEDSDHRDWGGRQA